MRKEKQETKGKTRQAYTVNPPLFKLLEYILSAGHIARYVHKTSLGVVKNPESWFA